jgi:polyisoprenyl-phosphate glycosyltransferase
VRPSNGGAVARLEWGRVRLVPIVQEVSLDISVLSPVYRNQDTLEELHRRLAAVFRDIPFTYEMIFINDASPDDSLPVLIDLSCTDSHLLVVDLPSNSGQQKAYLAGFSIARGRFILTLDADLQDPPEAIPDMLAEIVKGYNVVFAGRRGNYESRARLFYSRVYKTLLHLLTGIPADAGLFLVMTKDLMERVLTADLEGAHLVAVIACLAGKLVSTPVARSPRPSGKSAINFGMRLQMAFQGLAWVVGWKLGWKKSVNPARVSLPKGSKIYRDGIVIHEQS